MIEFDVIICAKCEEVPGANYQLIVGECVEVGTFGDCEADLSATGCTSCALSTVTSSSVCTDCAYTHYFSAGEGLCKEIGLNAFCPQEAKWVMYNDEKTLYNCLEECLPN